MPSNISFGIYFRKALTELNLVTEFAHAGSRIHKISSTVSTVIGDGGKGALQLRLLFCKIVCHD